MLRQALVQCLHRGWWSAECQDQPWSGMQTGAGPSMPASNRLTRQCSWLSLLASMLIGRWTWRQLAKMTLDLESQLWPLRAMQPTCTWSASHPCSRRTVRLSRRKPWRCKLTTWPMRRRRWSCLLSQEDRLFSLLVHSQKGLQSSQAMWAMQIWQWRLCHRMELSPLWQSQAWHLHLALGWVGRWLQRADRWNRDGRSVLTLQPSHQQVSWNVCRPFGLSLNSRHQRHQLGSRSRCFQDLWMAPKIWRPRQNLGRSGLLHR